MLNSLRNRIAPPKAPPPKTSKNPNITWSSVTVGMAIGHRMTIGRRMTVAGHGRVQRTQLQHVAMGRPTWAEIFMFKRQKPGEKKPGRADVSGIFLEFYG